jgi:hypothetical protein
MTGYELIASVGLLLIAVGIGYMVWQIVRSASH